MSQDISLHLQDEQFGRLRHEALRLGRTPSETAELLIEEALRLREHPFIEFRDSAAGRQAYLRGTRIAAWHIAVIARDFDGDSANTAAHLDLPESQVRAVLAYVSAFQDEIEAAIADDEWVADVLLPLAPGLRVTVADAPTP